MNTIPTALAAADASIASAPASAEPAGEGTRAIGASDANRCGREVDERREHVPQQQVAAREDHAGDDTRPAEDRAERTAGDDAGAERHDRPRRDEHESREQRAAQPVDRDEDRVERPLRGEARGDRGRDHEPDAEDEEPWCGRQQVRDRRRPGKRAPAIAHEAGHQGEARRRENRCQREPYVRRPPDDRVLGDQPERGVTWAGPDRWRNERRRADQKDEEQTATREQEPSEPSALEEISHFPLLGLGTVATPAGDDGCHPPVLDRVRGCEVAWRHGDGHAVDRGEHWHRRLPPLAGAGRALSRRMVYWLQH
jgi:hypothetical protein